MTEEIIDSEPKNDLVDETNFKEELVEEMFEDTKKKMTLKEFEKEYRKPNSDWKFDLFKIKCEKCNSEKVEFNGKTETVNGYYGEIDFYATNVIKCHDCGNAFEIKKTDSGIDYCSFEHTDE